MRKRHAEIAGGGIAGLSLGLMLARTGWSVRIHEREPEIREVGAGIYLRNNALEVLEEFGVMPALRATGSELTHQLTVDRRGGIMEKRTLDHYSRVLVLPRQALVEILAEAALGAGAELVTNSMVLGAAPSGDINLANGSILKADLAIGADGIYSKVRSSLGLGATYRQLPTTINRYLISQTELPADPVHIEHWAPNRRVGIAPAGSDWSFVYQVCRTKDAEGIVVPNNVDAWSASLPLLRREFEIFARNEVVQFHYQLVDCPTWSRGCAALIGDAAHGLPPTLGQGAGLAIMNARGLVFALSKYENVEEALRFWEDSIRYLTDKTQAWATRFDMFANRWPNAFAWMRWPVVWAFRNFSIFNDRMRIAEKGLSSTSLGGPLPTISSAE
jgi:2-polyprenyl-6-methoxyphenol hydroxylase-like FAD-dependent oxidoreductase